MFTIDKFCDFCTECGLSLRLIQNITHNDDFVQRNVFKMFFDIKFSKVEINIGLLQDMRKFIVDTYGDNFISVSAPPLTPSIEGSLCLLNDGYDKGITVRFQYTFTSRSLKITCDVEQPKYQPIALVIDTEPLAGKKCHERELHQSQSKTTVKMDIMRAIAKQECLLDTCLNLNTHLIRNPQADSDALAAVKRRVKVLNLNFEEYLDTFL